MSETRFRGHLALVPSLPDEPVEQIVSFCGHCGAAPAASVVRSRVCHNCGLGLVLEASSMIAPGPGDAFLVIDGSMSVCAVSAGAERLLATRETEAVNRHITELLVPAEVEAGAAGNLAVAITWAARGDGTTRRAMVRPANTFGVRLSARIGSCGPRAAALIVFD